MPRALLPLLSTAALALLGGSLSADYALRHFGGFDTLRLGQWAAYGQTPPDRPADAYSRASTARSAAIQLGRAEGISFFLSKDESGRPLSGRCRYMLAGEVPEARFFTLYPVSAAKIPLVSPGFGGRPAKLFSQDIIRMESGAFRIIISPQAESGNWLAAPQGRYILQLNLYDTPITAMTGLSRPAMPVLTRLKGGGCG